MADVSIDATVTPAVTSHGLNPVVFTTASIGYWFYVDADGTFGYSKTTNGGATWGAQVEINAATTHVAFCTWFDQWTPGDSGTLIHCWYFDSTNDAIRWRTLDTASDTLGTERTAFAGLTAVSGRNSFCSGTKTRSGYLYVAFDIDGGAEHGLVRSTDSGTNWSANLSAAFVIDTGAAQLDQCLCFPATGTGDNNDMWAVYQDSSADALTMKMWDSSAAAEVESATIQTMAENITEATGQMGFAASIRHSDGAIIIVSCSAFDAATNIDVFEVTAVNAGSLTGVTSKTSLATSIDDCYYPAVFIHQNSGTIFVAYNGKRDGSETLASATKVYYTKSTDGGTSWSAGDTAYMEGTAGTIVQVWTPISGPIFYAGWRLGGTLTGNAVNSVSSFVNVFTSSLSGALSFIGADVIRTGKGMAAALSFAGTAAKRMSRGLAGSLSFIGSLAAAKLFIRALTATLSFVGAQTKLVNKGFSAALSFVGAQTKAVAHKMTAALSFVGATAKRSTRALASALSFIGTFAKGSIYLRALTGTLSFIGAQSRSTRKALSASLSFVGTTSKRLVRALSGALSFVASVGKSSGKAFSGAISFSGSIKRAIAHKLTAAISFVGAFATQLVGGPVQFTKSLTAALSFSGAQSKATAHKITAAISFIGSAAKRSFRSFTATLSFVGAIKRSAGKALAATMSFSGATRRNVRKGIAGALSFIGAMGKRMPRAFTASLSFIGSFATSRVFRRALSASLSFVSEQSRRMSKTMSSALSFIGNFARAVRRGAMIFRNRLGSRGVNQS